jgi:hypothetical protein
MTDHMLDTVLFFFVTATIFFSIEIVCEHVFAEVNSNTTTTTAQVYVNTDFIGTTYSSALGRY